MKKLFPVVIVAVLIVVAAAVAWTINDRMSHMGKQMDVLVQELKESNRRLANVEDATLKLAKALP
jgi:hypothetical protein